MVPEPVSSEGPANDDAEVRVRGIAAGGAGVGELPDGRVVFVHRTVPGDVARVQLIKAKSRWAQARLVQILHPGEGRREAPCPYYARCGGCTLEHAGYEHQLGWKGQLVADALLRIGGVELTAPPDVEASPEQFRYRSRIAFHLRRLGGQRVVAGFHEIDNAGRVLDIGGQCLLPDERIARVWDRLRYAWGPGASRLPAGEGLRLTLRSVEEGVVLVVEGGRGEGEPAELLAAVKGLVAIWHRPLRDRPARLLAGSEESAEVWLGERYRVGASAFMQVNRAAGESLHRAVLAAVGDPNGKVIVDAYAGVGVLGRALARGGARVTALELDRDAARAAQVNPPEGFTMLQGSVESLLSHVLPADLVILNPPRGGVDAVVPARLAEAGVPRLVYVSCDPATLARDVARMSAAYRVDSVRCFDLFPQTAHVETLLVMKRAEA